MVCESKDFKYKDMQVLALTLCKSLTNTFFFLFSTLHKHFFFKLITKKAPSLS